MPTIRVTVPRDSWSVDDKAKIAETLTDGLNRVARDAGKGDIKPYVSVQIEETAEGGYAVGGKVVG